MNIEPDVLRVRVRRKHTLYDFIVDFPGQPESKLRQPEFTVQAGRNSPNCRKLYIREKQAAWMCSYVAGASCCCISESSFWRGECKKSKLSVGGSVKFGLGVVAY
jgi:hypothetical protein